MVRSQQFIHEHKRTDAHLSWLTTSAQQARFSCGEVEHVCENAFAPTAANGPSSGVDVPEAPGPQGSCTREGASDRSLDPRASMASSAAVR